MEAVILSGGFGTRLRPLTLTRPKPLLPIANIPMVQHILDSLPPEVDKAVLAAGYMVEALRTFAEQLDHRVELVVVDEDKPLGTGGAIKNVESEITGPFFAFNGDILSSAPLAKLAKKRAKADAIGILALWKVDDPSEFGVARLEGDRIVEFVEKPPKGTAPSDLINAGMYCFDQAMLDHIPKGVKTSIERETWPKVIAEDLKLLGLPFDGYWVDCGRPDDYLEAHRILLKGNPIAKAPGARMDGQSRGFVAIGLGAHVDAGATVENVVLLPNARIEGGAVVTDSILGEGAVVETGAVVQNCVIGDAAVVASGTAIKHTRIGPEEVHSHG